MSIFRCGLWASSGPFPLSAHYGLYKRGRDPPPPTNPSHHLKKERSVLPLKWLLKEDRGRRPTAASAAAALSRAAAVPAAKTAASPCLDHVLSRAPPPDIRRRLRPPPLPLFPFGSLRRPSPSPSSSRHTRFSPPSPIFRPTKFLHLDSPSSSPPPSRFPLHLHPHASPNPISPSCPCNRNPPDRDFILPNLSSLCHPARFLHPLPKIPQIQSPASRWIRHYRSLTPLPIIVPSPHPNFHPVIPQS